MVRDITIQKARFRDVPILNNMFMQSIESSFHYFSDIYKDQLRKEHTRLKFLKALCSSQSCFLLAYDRNEPAGYSLARIDGHETGFIHWMYVLPQMRGKGLGAALLTESQSQLGNSGVRRVRLITHDQMEFYRHFGYMPRGQIVNDGSGVSMTIMEAAL